MTRILHVADSYLGAVPFANERRAADLWRGFERAVDCAIELGVDVFLHAGALFTQFELPPDAFKRAYAQTQRLLDAHVTPVLHQTDHDLYGLDVDVLTGGESLHACGVTFATDLHATPAGASVLVMSGAVAGLGGLDRSRPAIDAGDLVDVPFSYVALAGSLRLQAVHETAWYSGQTARVSPGDTNRPSGLVIDLAADTPHLASVSWPDRPHQVVIIEAPHLDEAGLVHAIEQRVDMALQHAGEAAVLTLRVDGACIDAEQAAECVTILRGGDPRVLQLHVTWNGRPR